MNISQKVLAMSLSVSLLGTGAGMSQVAQAHDASHESVTKTDSKAVELRSSLDMLLSEHAYLAADTMRKGAEGSKDFDESVKSLNMNTKELSKAIGDVYGKDAGMEFEKMWSEHIGYFVDYVNATKSNDEKGRQEALNNLDNYRETFSQFMATATDEKLEAKGLSDGLQMHVNQLVSAFDASVNGDYDKAYKYERESIHHMYMVSKGLSDAITKQFPEDYHHTSATTKAADLRSDLNYLMSEHAALAADAMQNGYDGSENYKASVKALEMNTKDLSKAIEDAYGKDAGMEFEKMWSEHIGYFVDYVEASKNKDKDAKQEAKNNLDNYSKEFGAFLSKATDNQLKSNELADGLGMHVDQLLASFDAYTKGDYKTSTMKVREAYAHMFMPAKGLSNAIVMQNKSDFEMDMPKEMPDTGAQK
ncbi:copper amine oxidase [Mammaliicoccus lentus]|uniref:copper amine oxidase n=1 Tax=Mammaliicoccus lentus TaxID=42858 RepID=UPI0010721774|nr:copper amine oxidase [Mammaliicoccus lentus]MBF0794338.1 copper amine oxidase [Mammaliicoccus lentus]TFV16217.1 copper amine oxidase [Mammaliicoccus lentus]